MFLQSFLYLCLNQNRKIMKIVGVQIEQDESAKIEAFINELPKSQNVSTASALFRMFKNLIIEGKIEIKTNTQIQIKN
jgi:hypothetical protein